MARIVYYHYDDWGNLLSIVTATEGNATQLAIETANPLRYRGYYYDAETGYYYLQSRYYDPSICRFINVDMPEFLGIGESVAKWNLFSYCENEPVNAADLDGFFTIKIYAIAAVTAAVISAIAKIVANYGKGYRGKKLFRGVLGASIGSAVNIVLLMKLVKWGTKGMVWKKYLTNEVT